MIFDNLVALRTINDHVLVIDFSKLALDIEEFFVKQLLVGIFLLILLVLPLFPLTLSFILAIFVPIQFSRKIDGCFLVEAIF